MHYTEACNELPEPILRVIAPVGNTTYFEEIS